MPVRGRVRPGKLALEDAIQHVVENASGLAHRDDPYHGKALIRQLLGYVRVLDELREDDPLLYAYALKDRLPPVASNLIELYAWCAAITEATPDQIADAGAT